MGKSIIEAAHNHAGSVIRAMCSTNPTRAKLKAKEVRELLIDARLLGALDAAEKILCAFQGSADVLQITDAQEMKDIFLGDLHIFITELHNYMAKKMGKSTLTVRVEDLIDRYKPTGISSPSHPSACSTSDPLPGDL